MTDTIRIDERIQIDGVYRPEQMFEGRWQAVAYVQHWNDMRQRPRRTWIERLPAQFVVKHRKFPAFFDTEAEAQAACDKLNKGKR